MNKSFLGAQSSTIQKQSRVSANFRNIMAKIYQDIEVLLSFAHQHLMLAERDLLVARHRLYLFLRLKGAACADSKGCPSSIYAVCEPILEWAAENARYDGQSITERDLFLANLIGQVMPLASTIQAHFWNLYRKEPSEATSFFYELSQNSAYIRSDRLAQNFSWQSGQSSGQSGQMEITINLSKPEKDPKAIAAAVGKQSAGYPQCVLCIENEGYPGHVSWAPRFNHRIVELQLGGKDFALQYSPYSYYSEHSIVLSKEHKPMSIDKQTFVELFDFVDQFPHYMVGSNADLPIVGGSILSHHHFQAGRYEFPMFRAPAKEYAQGCGKGRAKSVEILEWPLSVLKLSGKEAEPLIEQGSHILEFWRNYSDGDSIVAYTGDVPHNTITPILRRSGDLYEFYLVLRNNRTSEEHPLGIFHPHREIHHIKKENIGLIEVMGLAVLPGRLKEEMLLMQNYLEAKGEAPQAHLPWLDSLKLEPDLKALLQREIAAVFSQGLSHCGVMGDWQRFLQLAL